MGEGVIFDVDQGFQQSKNFLYHGHNVEIKEVCPQTFEQYTVSCKKGNFNIETKIILVCGLYHK